MHLSLFIAAAAAFFSATSALSLRSNALTSRAKFCTPTNSSSSSINGLFSLTAADIIKDSHSTKPTHFMYFPPPSTAATTGNGDVLVLSKSHYRTDFNLTNGKLTTPNGMSCLIYFEDLPQGTPVVCGAFPNPKSRARNQTWRAEDQCLFNVLTKVLVPVFNGVVYREPLQIRRSEPDKLLDYCGKGCDNTYEHYPAALIVEPA
ncbi:hypothetical protein DL95DRAFT_439796 [Leptodontidium sp. 2 PMI_412]|nr:hypothetical protein BKA61DRAFT_612652 [Leptodontidium sp. MPI-SDFR-AT-0119]KAH9224704.1 hypothetical protein DL95DRAFT_439796 [Leptodontidium sp. 2 PMI_412]